MVTTISTDKDIEKEEKEKEEEKLTTTIVLISFYRNETITIHNHGVTTTSIPTLQEIWNYNHDEMESKHDWIQWVFPIKTVSKFNNQAEATLASEKIQIIFQTDETIQKNLRRSLELYLDFLGLKLVKNSKNKKKTKKRRNNDNTKGNDDTNDTHHKKKNRQLECLKAANFKKRFSNWSLFKCLEGNHNWRRISRMLECLVLCHMHEEAEAILEELKRIYGSGRLGNGPQQANAMSIWIKSAGKSESLPTIQSSQGCIVM